MTTALGAEAQVLASRWGVRKSAVLNWLKARNLVGATDFRERWPGEWTDSNDAALTDFWAWGTERSTAKRIKEKI